MQRKCNNRRTVYSPGPSQWAFDGDCRWLWLDSLFCLCPLVQDHTHDVGVPPDPLPPLLRLLLFQRANVCAADSAHLLGRAHLAHGRQIPARQRKNCHFQAQSTCTRVFCKTGFFLLQPPYENTKTQLKHSQEHVKPSGGDITLTLKPCGPIRSLKKATTGTGGLARSYASVRQCCARVHLCENMSKFLLARLTPALFWPHLPLHTSCKQRFSVT